MNQTVTKHYKVGHFLVIITCLGIATISGLIFTQVITPTKGSLWMLISLILVFKFLSWRDAEDGRLRFFLWIGMDAREFYQSKPFPKQEQTRQWIRAFIEIASGITLLTISREFSESLTPSVVAWIKICGLTFLIYFGSLRLLACIWQSLGYGAIPLMNNPLSARNLFSFWSFHWNRAFPYLMRKYFYRPWKKKVGVKPAIFGTFLVSGILHEMIVSVPARAGYGLPILYFALQAFGVYVQHSAIGKKLNLHHGVLSKVYAAFVLMAPLGLLFHEPFMTKVVLQSL